MFSYLQSNSTKMLNLTPFKYCICAILHELLNKNLISYYNDIDIMNGIFLLINDYKCEISSKILESRIDKIFEFLQIKFPNENSLYKKFSNEFKEILIYSLNEINDVNDVYEFFNCKVRELKHKSEIISQNRYSTIEQGGFIDIFLRKCMVAFYKMSFEDLTKLYEKIKLYEKGDEILITLTLRESQYLFDKQINEFTFFSNNEEEKKMNEKLLDFYNYRQKFYFSENLNNLTREKNHNNQLHGNFNFNKNLNECDLNVNKENLDMKMLFHKEKQENENIIFSLLDPTSDNYIFSSGEKNCSHILKGILHIFKNYI